MSRKAIAIALAALSVTILSACNTVQGVGRDIESVGKAGEDAL
ncbi:entericidin [Altererythrobacter sp. B11]|nr:entericidin A/B family lipoprotein [Altererythrobacter sp. B11]BBC71524.1 entericidin [Altererythrobacter sp. B11]